MQGAEESVKGWAFVRRVLGRRCPQCADGELFATYARLRESCPVCGLVYRREQGAQTGAMYLTAAVNQLFAVAVMAAFWFFSDWGVAASLAVAVPVVLGFSVLFLPYSMALWVAVEYWTDVKNGERWVSPRP
jgi:uncharacterized protein (DUF983 family)